MGAGCLGLEKSVSNITQPPPQKTDKKPVKNQLGNNVQQSKQLKNNKKLTKVPLPYIQVSQNKPSDIEQPSKINKNFKISSVIDQQISLGNPNAESKLKKQQNNKKFNIIQTIDEKITQKNKNQTEDTKNTDMNTDILQTIPIARNKNMKINQRKISGKNQTPLSNSNTNNKANLNNKNNSQQGQIKEYQQSDLFIKLDNSKNPEESNMKSKPKPQANNNLKPSASPGMFKKTPSELISQQQNQPNKIQQKNNRDQLKNIKQSSKQLKSTKSLKQLKNTDTKKKQILQQQSFFKLTDSCMMDQADLGDLE